MHSIRTNSLSKLLICLAISAMLVACGGSEKRQEKYLQRAQELYDADNYEKSTIEAKNVLQINPKNKEARLLLGKLFLKKENFRQAFGNFNAAIEEDPDYIEPRIEMAKILFMANKNAQAKEHVGHVLAINPKDRDARTILAGLQAREGDKATAIKTAESVIADFPGDSNAIAVLAPLYSEQDQAKSMALIEKGLEANKDSLILKQLKLKILAASGKAKETEQLLIELTKRNPQELSFYYQLAQGYARSNRLEDADKVLQQAITNNPENDDPKLKMIEFSAQRLGFDKTEAKVKQFIAIEPDKFDFYGVLAQLYVKQGDVEKAKNVFRGIIAEQGIKPIALTARTSLTKILLLEKNRKEAEKLLYEVFSVEPTNTEALVLKAGIKYTDRDVKGAIADLRAALKNDSEFIPALKMLAIAQESEGSAELALDNYRKILTIDNSNMDALLASSRLSLELKHADDAEMLLNRLITLDPVNERGAMLLTGVLVGKQDWEKAKQVVKPLLENENSRTTGLLLSAHTSRAQNNWKDAKNAYTEALGISPEKYEAVAGYVDTYLVNKDYPGAINFLENYSADNPSLMFVKDLLATVYAKSGKNENAKKLYRQMIEQAPNRESLYRKLAALYASEGNQEKTEATYLSGIKQNPNFIGLQLMLANHYDQRRKFGLSKKYYEEVLKRQPNVSAARNNLAVLLVDHYPSEENFNRALELVANLKMDNNPGYLDTLGWIHYHMNNLPQAISYLEAAISHEQKRPEFHYHLGMAYRKNGQKDKAKEQLQLATSDETNTYSGIDQARETLKLL